MSAEPRCSFESQIERLLAGDLPEDQEANLATHLRGCATCRTMLEELTPKDLLPSAEAKRLVGRKRTPDDELSRIMGSLRASVPPEIEATTEMPAVTRDKTQPVSSDVSLDFLTHSDHPQALGNFADHDILGVIGSGGMGIVLKAHDPALNRIVAIKVLKPELAANGAARQRFTREAQKAAAVTHDHVVTEHAVGEVNGLPYIVMEYIVGVSLEERIRRTGPLKLEEILRIGMQAASGLAAAHAQGLVHRDVKPSNILLENGIERVKIADFGLARAMDDAQITQTGLLAGTPEYMSPEQAQDKELDHRSDLFSLGSVLYAMCTGRSPFRASNPAAAIRRVCDDTPRPIREVNSEIPPWLVDIVDQLLAKNPEDRIQTATEVQEVLGAHLAHLQQPNLVPPPTARAKAQRSRPNSGSKRLVWAATAVAALAVCTLGFIVMNSNKDDDVPPTPDRSSLEVEIASDDIRVIIQGQEDPIAVTKGTPPLHLAPGPYEFTVWDVRQNEELRRDSITIGRDEKRFISVRPYRTPPLREAETTLLGHIANTKTYFSADGTFVITGSSDGTVTIRTHEDGHWETTREIRAHTGTIHDVAISSGRKLAVAGDNGFVTVWDMASWEQCKSLLCHTKSVWDVAFSPDGRLLATAGGDGVVKIWDCTTWSEHRRINADPRAVRCLEFSPDGEYLATAGNDQNVRLWNVETGEQMRTFVGHSSEVKSLVFGPNGDTLVSAASDSLAIIWDMDTGHPIRTVGSDHVSVWMSRRAVFSRDGEILAVADGDLIKLWDWKKGRLIDQFAAHWGEICSIDFSPDGSSFVTGSADRTVKIWRIAETRSESIPQPKNTIVVPSMRGFSRLVSFSPRDPDLLAIGSLAGKSVRLWNVKQRKMQGWFDAHGGGGLWGMAFLPDGTLVTSGRADDGTAGGIRLWELASRQRLKNTPCFPIPGSLAVASDNRSMACLALEGATGASLPTQVIDAESEESRFAIPVEDAPSNRGIHRSLAWSPDATVLVIGTAAGFVTFWDGQTGGQRGASLRHGQDSIWGVAFSPDGQTLVSASADSTIKLWDISDLEGPQELGSLDGHDHSVFSVVFSPDGKLLVSTGGDFDLHHPDQHWHHAEVRIWDVPSRRLVASFAGHTESVWHACFSADGNTLVTSGRDCKVHLWDVAELLELGITDEGDDAET